MDGLGILAAVVALEAFVLVVVGVVTVFAPVTGQWAIEPAEIVRWIDPPADPDGPEPFDAGKVDRNMALLLGARANENAERLAFRYAWFTVAVPALAVEVLAPALTVWRYTT